MFFKQVDFIKNAIFGDHIGESNKRKWFNTDKFTYNDIIIPIEGAHFYFHVKFWNFVMLRIRLEEISKCFHN